MEGYLLIHCGYEGIEDLIGLFSQDEVLEKVQAIRAVCGGHKIWKARRDEFSDYEQWDAASDAAYEASGELAKRFWRMDPERVCVQHVDRDGAKCVCAELGVQPSKQIMY